VFEFYWVWFLQSQWRMVLAQRFLNHTRLRLTAALQIQRAWRSHKASAWYRKLRSGIVMFQAHIRGYLARRRLREVKQSQEEEVRRVTTSDFIINHFLQIAIFLPVKFRVDHTSYFLSTNLYILFIYIMLYYIIVII
jgi:IQ calmodulin-binding motif.